MRPETLKHIAIALLVLDIATAGYAVLFGEYPPPSPLIGGDVTSYRIVYVHVPANIAGYAAFTTALVASIAFLAKGRITYDSLAAFSVPVGLAYSAVGIVSGMMWSAEMWGAPWSWDPRQTSTLIMWLAFLAYVAIRKSISDPDRMRVTCATFAIAAFITMPLSYLSMHLFPTLHRPLEQHPLPPGGKLLLLGVRMPVSLAFLMAVLAYYYLTIKVSE